jgi:hypothetical protein
LDPKCRGHLLFIETKGCGVRMVSKRKLTTT